MKLNTNKPSSYMIIQASMNRSTKLSASTMGIFARSALGDNFLANAVKSPLLYLSICANLALTTTSIAGSETLTKAECSLIQGYGKVSEDTFSDHFTKMVHQREYCRTTGKNCEIPLQKRMDDFYVLFDGGKAIKSKSVKNAAEIQVITLIKQLPELLKLNLILEKPTEADQFPLENIIAVYFIDNQAINKDFEGYFNTKIAGQSHPEYSSVKKTFKQFLNRGDACRFNLSDPDDSGIKGVHIWVSTDIDEFTMQQCISEGFYTSLGLGSGAEVDSIFDYNYARTAGNYSLSEFDLLKLKLLYRDEFKPGMPKVQTRKAVEQLISNECGAFK